MKNNLKKMAKAITLGLVLGTTLTATSSVWADAAPVAPGTGTNSVIMNNTGDNKATGAYSTAFGSGTEAKGDFSTAFGKSTTASGESSTAFGDNTKASGQLSTAFGLSTTASKLAATAFGQETTASEMYSTAFGLSTTASGQLSTAFGQSTTASGQLSTAFGLSTTASGQLSTAFGQNTTASGKLSTAFGDNTKASGYAATAFGENTTASAYAATAFGQGTTASGMYSTAFGQGTTASAYAAAAFGASTTASGMYSTAFGLSSKAGGSNSLAALGGVTGDWSGETPTGGANAVAIGVGAVAKADNSVAIGAYAQTGLATTQHTTPGTKEVITEFAVGGGTDGSGNTYYSQITGVADGVNDHDAVNLKQVQTMLGGAGTGEAFTKLKDDVAGIHDDINGLNSQIDRMGTRIDKVGAGAAALAAMHPVYDEDSKLTFSAGLGAYRGEQAAAVGMFYRFTDRVMMNAGATVGNNDNMYNVGLNFALDRNVGSKLPSKAVMAKQLNAQNERIDALTAENQDMKKEIAELKAMVQALIANK